MTTCAARIVLVSTQKWSTDRLTLPLILSTPPPALTCPQRKLGVEHVREGGPAAEDQTGNGDTSVITSHGARVQVHLSQQAVSDLATTPRTSAAIADHRANRRVRTTPPDCQPAR